MKFNDTLKMSVVGLSTHKSRSTLTILGIVIGITSIILVMAIGDSAKQMIVGEIQGLGPNNVYIIPGRQPTGPNDAASTILTDSIKLRDVEDLKKKNNVPDAILVEPLVFGPAGATYQAEIYNATLMGSDENIADTFNVNVATGDMYSAEDVAQKSDVVVIGQKVASKLFGLSDPIGEKIKIKNKSFRVIGVLEPKGQSPFVNFDEAILTPYSTAQQYILGIKYFQRVLIKASSTDTINNVIIDIKALLRANHNITDPAKDDFFIQTQSDIVNTISTITNVLTILLSSVAAISLIVGGIGIMNIMLVSVTERTREIGLRKALGATNKDILFQFLIEAIILTFSGGIIGIILGILLSFGASVGISRGLAVNFPFVIPIMGIVLGVSVSVVIGLVFGIFPARQAAKKSPMEALRYE